MNYFRGLTDDECKIYDSWINQESINTGENLFNISNDSKPKTNGDRIRQMTDEELARFLDRTCGCSVCFLDIMTGECASFKSSKDCIANKVKWLKQEVKEDGQS